MTYVTSFERDALEEGFEKGIVQGKELGVVEGMEKGMEKGMERGLLQGRLEVARKLMASGLSAEQAATIADVSVTLLQSS